jgi:hypothetical protein
MEIAATACAWCGAGGDNGSAASFVVPSAAVAPIDLAEAAAGPGSALPTGETVSLLPAQANLKGIGGWLILIAIGLGLGAISLLLALGGFLLLLFSPASQALLAAHPGFGSVLWFEAIASVVFLAAIIALNFLFYQKRRDFPRWAIAFLAANFLLDAAIQQMMLQYVPTYPSFDAFVSLSAAAIWIPYFLISKRVKQTFVN